MIIVLRTVFCYIAPRYIESLEHRYLIVDQVLFKMKGKFSHLFKRKVDIIKIHWLLKEN